MPPEQLVGPNQDVQGYWSGLLDFDVEREFLTGKLNELRKDDCLGMLKVRRVPVHAMHCSSLVLRGTSRLC